MNDIFTIGGKWCGLWASSMEACKLQDKSRAIMLGSNTMYRPDQPPCARGHQDPRKSLPIQRPNSISL